jgi:hypothetical protein
MIIYLNGLLHRTGNPKITDKCCVRICQAWLLVSFIIPDVVQRLRLCSFKKLGLGGARSKVSDKGRERLKIEITNLFRENFESLSIVEMRIRSNEE